VRAARSRAPRGSPRDRDLALDVALAAHEQVVVRGIGARAADRAGREGTKLGVAQPAVAQHPQQRVIALAHQRALVGRADEVAVLHRGQRLRRPEAMRRHPHRGRVLLEPELREQRTQHRQVHVPRRRRRRPPAAAAMALLLAAVGGDRVGRHVGDDGRAAELVAQRVAEARVDRAVLPRARGARRAAGDEVADGVEVRLEQLLASGQRRRQPRGRDRREQLDVQREGAAICEVGHLGCRKPGGSDGARSGGAWGRAHLMVV